MQLALWALLLLAQYAQPFEVRLSAVPATTATRSSITGEGTAAATVANGTLSISGSFEGLQSPATMAQLHLSPVTGVRGPVIGDLTITKATSGSLSGSVHLTRDQLDSLSNGCLYIQIHSEKAPDGNLWGWLLRRKR
jgi:CHRD domain